MYSRTTEPRLFAMQESRTREFFASRGMFDPGGPETIIDEATTLGNRTHRGRASRMDGSKPHRRMVAVELMAIDRSDLYYESDV